MSPSRARFVLGVAALAAALTFLTPGAAQAAPADAVASTTVNAARIRVPLLADQNGRITFPATAGQDIQVMVSGSQVDSDVAVSVLRPDGTTSASTTGCGLICRLTVPTLTATGTHTVLVDPLGTKAGTVDVQVYETTLTVPVTVGGPAATVTTADWPQDVLFTFAGVAGQRVALSARAVSDLDWRSRTLTAPDGSVLMHADSSYHCSQDCLTGPVVLPADGTYLFRIAPGHAAPFTFRVGLVDPDLSVPAVPGGAPVALTFTTPGQNGVVTFTGTVGQRVSAVLTDPSSGAFEFGVDLYSPSGVLLTNGMSGYGGACPTACLIGARTLPEDGVYTFRVDPWQSSTGTLNIAFYDVPVAETALVVDGPSASATASVPGQEPTFRFTGTAGGRLMLRVDAHEFPNTMVVDVFGPDGRYLKGASGCGGTWPCDIEDIVPVLSGEHTVVLHNRLLNGTVSARLYASPELAPVPVALDAPPVALTATAPGQRPALTFTAGWKQKVGIRLTGGTYDPTTTKVQVLDPSGTVMATNAGCGTGCYLEIAGNRATGTYTVVVDPDGVTTGTITASVTDGRELTTATTLGDPAVPLTVALPAQSAVATFAGTAGQKVFVQFTGGTYGLVSNATATVRKPDGGTLSSTNCGTTCAFETFTLPSTGTYSVVHDPKGEATGTVTFRAWAVAPDLAFAVTADGSATAVTTTTPGQNATLSFAGTAGQRIAVRLSGGTYPSADATVVLRRPDGGTLTQNVSCGVTCFLDTRALPTTGTYTLLVDPEVAAVGGITAQVYDVPADAAVTTTPGGGPNPVAVTAVGQNAVVSFTATAGQVVTVAVTGATFGPSTGYVLRRPDGSTLTSKTSSGANTTFASVTLPAAGVYSLLIDPATTATGTATVTVS